MCGIKRSVSKRHKQLKIEELTAVKDVISTS